MSSNDVSAGAMIRPPDPDRIFIARARRLREFAAGHPLQPFLAFVAALADVQHAVAKRADAPAEAGLGPACLRTGAFEALLQAFLEGAGGVGAGDGPERVRASLLAADWSARLALAEAMLAGDPGIDPGAGFYVALALQAHLARLAAAPVCADAAVFSVTRNCPRCGSRPFASVIEGGAAAGARYCCCALCGTQWRHLRAACTGCGKMQALELCRVEGGEDYVSAECCAACGTYIKLFRRDRQASLDPVADDLASCGLDLMMNGARYVRRVANPLMLFERTDPA